MEDVFIHAEGLCKIFVSGDEQIHVLNNLNLTITPGETITVLGVSGTGKSTLLNIFGGIDQASSGTLKIGKFNLPELSANELTRYRREMVGFVFQFYNLIPSLTALENVLCALEATGRYGHSHVSPAKDILSAVGLSDKFNRFPEQLSGGEQQRVAFARALAKKPPLILADEPTGNLDPNTGMRVLEVLINQVRETGATLIIVTHNPEVGRLTNRCLSLQNGLLVKHNYKSNA